MRLLTDAFANRRAPGRDATFEEGWLLLPEDFEFYGCEWPNDPTRCRAALSRLSANGLLDLEKNASGGVRVRLGKH